MTTDTQDDGRIVIKYSEAMADEIARKRKELRNLERQFNLDTMALSGLAEGEVLRDVHTGARYRLESVCVWGKSTHQVTVYGRRLYSTGRRDASTATALFLSDLRKC